MANEEEYIERVCLSPNSQCNLSCKYCYFFQNKEKIAHFKKLSAEEIYTILNKIYEYQQNSSKMKKPIKINFVGGGEPLLSWKEIKKALHQLFSEQKHTRMKFYTVTNGLLLTKEILVDMATFNLTPSISLDGYKEINDKNRITKTGKGTFDNVMKSLALLNSMGFELIINTTITFDLMRNLEEFFSFVIDNGISKVIFDRLVDPPPGFPSPSYRDYYKTLERILVMQKQFSLQNIEIGNLEAYKRSINHKADKVCTMFGSVCGAGINSLIYLGREVYPCGRMFNNDYWKLGDYNEPLKKFQKVMMIKKIPKRNDCLTCSIKEICIKDCILEQERKDYDCSPRKIFINKLLLNYVNNF